MAHIPTPEVKDISTSSMMPVNDFMNTATTAMHGAQNIVSDK